MKKHEIVCIKRFGDVPLRFVGERIATAGMGGADENRWHVLDLYQLAEEEGWVASVAWHSKWDNEPSLCVTAKPLRNVKELSEFFTSYDPLQHFIGPWEGHPKRDTIVRQIRSQYADAVTDLFDQTQITEEA